MIDCKGKQRVILLPQSLMLYLTQYCQKQRIVRGSIFVTKKTGRRSADRMCGRT